MNYTNCKVIILATLGSSYAAVNSASIVFATFCFTLTPAPIKT